MNCGKSIIPEIAEWILSPEKVNMTKIGSGDLIGNISDGTLEYNRVNCMDDIEQVEKYDAGKFL